MGSRANTSLGLFLAVVAVMATGAHASDGDQVAPFFGFMGAMSALVFSCMGAAYGTAKSGVGIASMGVMRPELVMKSIVPVVMAGVLGIYGLIIAVIISTNSTSCATKIHNPGLPPIECRRADASSSTSASVVTHARVTHTTPPKNGHVWCGHLCVVTTLCCDSVSPMGRSIALKTQKNECSAIT